MNVNRCAYSNDALAQYRAPRQAPRDPSRGFLIAMALLGAAGPLLAFLIGG